jgi:hypothetical protein
LPHALPITRSLAPIAKVGAAERRHGLGNLGDRRFFCVRVGSDSESLSRRARSTPNNGHQRTDPPCRKVPKTDNRSIMTTERGSQTERAPRVAGKQWPIGVRRGILLRNIRVRRPRLRNSRDLLSRKYARGARARHNRPRSVGYASSRRGSALQPEHRHSPTNTDSRRVRDKCADQHKRARLRKRPKSRPQRGPITCSSW